VGAEDADAVSAIELDWESKSLAVVPMRGRVLPYPSGALELD